MAKFIPYLTLAQLEKSLISTYLAHNSRITHAGPSTIQVPLQSNLLTLLIKNLDLTLQGPLSHSEWNSLWKAKLNARHRLMLWKIAWDILPTSSTLAI
jgi:hypothetical protein